MISTSSRRDAAIINSVLPPRQRQPGFDTGTSRLTRSTPDHERASSRGVAPLASTASGSHAARHASNIGLDMFFMTAQAKELRTGNAAADKSLRGHSNSARIGSAPLISRAARKGVMPLHSE